VIEALRLVYNRISINGSGSNWGGFSEEVMAEPRLSAAVNLMKRTSGEATQFS
jgi:hypothetical protein